MKRSHWVLALTSALVTLMVAPVASAEPPGKAEVCHRAAADTTEVPEWRLITVSVKSLDKHIEHGDGEPLSAVPGTEGLLFFDETCGFTSSEPGDPGDPGDPPNSETLFAVAYTDMDENGAYDPNTDVLIAKFVDGPSPNDDGVPGTGDVIITGHYPMDLGLLSFGRFGVNEHSATGVTPSSTRCFVATSGGTFIWDASTTLENYEERSSSGLSFFRDSFSSASDAVVAAKGSPSQPMTTASVGDFDDSDRPFLEVETNCSE